MVMDEESKPEEVLVEERKQMEVVIKDVEREQEEVIVQESKWRWK